LLLVIGVFYVLRLSAEVGGPIIGLLVAPSREVEFGWAHGARGDKYMITPGVPWGFIVGCLSLGLFFARGRRPAVRILGLGVYLFCLAVEVVVVQARGTTIMLLWALVWSWVGRSIQSFGKAALIITVFLIGSVLLVVANPLTLLTEAEQTRSFAARLTTLGQDRLAQAHEGWQIISDAPATLVLMGDLQTAQTRRIHQYMLDLWLKFGIMAGFAGLLFYLVTVGGLVASIRFFPRFPWWVIAAHALLWGIMATEFFAPVSLWQGQAILGLTLGLAVRGSYLARTNEAQADLRQADYF
ncbi:MAG: hypothetical protein ACP5HU_03790, partial [Phycisphaerae bacterium]